MGTKNNPGRFDCHANALPDEPLFTLLARDKSAPAIIEMWAATKQRAIADGVLPKEDSAKVQEAFMCAKQMRKWRKENDGAWRKKQS